jgi:hypothetical protein
MGFIIRRCTVLRIRFKSTHRYFAAALFSFLFILCLLAYHCPNAWAVTGEVGFDPSTDSRVVGYKLYYGTSSSSFEYSVDLGNRTSYTVSDLGPGTVYYFAASAYDADRNESELSDILTATVAEENPIGETNSPPVADAGPEQTVEEGATVTLSAANSTDPNKDIVGVFWEQTDGPAVEISDPEDVEVTFTAPDVGPDGASLSFRLMVIDSQGLTSEDSCIVNISWVNLTPTANAGMDQAVDEGVTVILSGLDSSDPDDGIVSYLWEQTGGPKVVLSDAAAAKLTFTAPDVTYEDASLTFRLTVQDSGGLRSTDTCVVNVSWTNAPPVADAGLDQKIKPRSKASLDGSKSYDGDDGIASVRWTQKSGTPVILRNPTAVKTTFVTPKKSGVLEFQLTVTDKGGLTSQDTCKVTVGY